MAIDQKLTELPVASAIGSNDACLLVSNGNDYQFAMSLLLQYVGSNLNTGASISFGTNLPQNNSGKNGDVFINTLTGAMAQKTAETWTITYTPPVSTQSTGNTILYGIGLPTTSTGANGDTYVNTATGVFYKKALGIWSQVFSIQSGPAGPQGTKGDTGTTGVDGNSLLHGANNPSNQITGKNGDFYINTNNLHLFGPKTNGDWGSSIALIQSASDFIIVDFPTGSTTPISVNNYQSLYTQYGNYPTLIVQEVIDPNTSRCRSDIQPMLTYTSNLLDSITIDIPASAENKSTFHLQLIIKP